MRPIRVLLRIVGTAFGLALLLSLVGAEEGCGPGLSGGNPGMVDTPPSPPPGSPELDDSYKSHKARSKTKARRAR